MLPPLIVDMTARPGFEMKFVAEPCQVSVIILMLKALSDKQRFPIG